MKYLLFLILIFNLNAQTVPRYLWNPVIKPIEWLPNDPDPNDPKQRSFDDPLNTGSAYKLSRTESRQTTTILTINNEKVTATDTWLVHYYESLGRAGLDASKLIPMETKTMSRRYIHPDGHMVVETIPNEHSDESSLVPYDIKDKLNNAQFYGNYFVLSTTWESNRDANQNVVDNSFVDPLENIVSVRNINEVMKLGDLNYKMRILNRFPHRHDIIFTTVNGSIVQ